VALDARMNEIYAACYEREGDGVRRTGSISLAAASAVDLAAVGPGWLVCGNAAAAYPEFAARVSWFRTGAGRLPRAAAVARLGALALARGEGRAAELALPLYVRDRVAETVAERLARGGRA
jgi:tRNA threonylcarbamoyladenosine biosynthesis protein TsaB